MCAPHFNIRTDYFETSFERDTDLKRTVLGWSGIWCFTNYTEWCILRAENMWPCYAVHSERRYTNFRMCEGLEVLFNILKPKIKLNCIPYSAVNTLHLSFTGVLISPSPDQEGNKLQRQKILSSVYPIYNHNWRNISTICIYNKTSIKRNILTIEQNTSGSRSG
jgi:hypothetical protein